MELHLNQMSNEDLVSASQEGRKSAYAALVHRHSKRIYAVCLGILGNVTDSEDIVQETFVKGMTHIHTLRETSQFEGWIAQIARNLCRDHLRKQKRRREHAEKQPRETGSVSVDFTELHDALGRLPEEHRLPLMLFYFDGKSTEKLAQELNLTRAGACTRLFRARNELRKLLAKEGDIK